MFRQLYNLLPVTLLAIPIDLGLYTEGVTFLTGHRDDDDERVRGRVSWLLGLQSVASGSVDAAIYWSSVTLVLGTRLPRAVMTARTWSARDCLHVLYVCMWQIRLLRRHVRVTQWQTVTNVTWTLRFPTRDPTSDRMEIMENGSCMQKEDSSP